MRANRTIFSILSLLLALILVFPVEAFAEMPDFSAMTDEELHEIINSARNELKKRELLFAEDTALIDQDKVKVYLTGKYEIVEYFYPEDQIGVAFEAIVINDSDKTIGINFDSATVNGWDVGYGGISEVTAGHKKKVELELYISDAGISTFEEIEDVVFALGAYDPNIWTVLFHVEPVTVHFN